MLKNIITIGYRPKVDPKFLNRMRRKMSLSLILVLLSFVLICISFFTPWWSIRYQEKDRGDSEWSTDEEFCLYLNKVSIEETEGENSITYIPLETPEDVVFEYMEIIFFLVLAQMILGLGVIVIVSRLRLKFEGFRLTLLFMTGLVILSIICVVLFSYSTVHENEIDSLWGDDEAKDYFNQYRISYHPHAGFYLMSSSVILLVTAFVLISTMCISKKKKFYLRVSFSKPIDINWFHLSGIIILGVATILLFISMANPWWSCDYYPDESETRYSSMSFKWGLETQYLSVDLDETEEISPFHGSVSREIPLSTQQSDAGDYRETNFITYEHEKSILTTTNILVYISLCILLIAIAIGIFSQIKKKKRVWVLFVSLVSCVILIISLTFFSIAFPNAYKEDMREPYIAGNHPIPSYSQANLISGFSGECTDEFELADWIDDYNNQPGREGDVLDAKIYQHYEWGPSIGYYLCLIAVILEMIAAFLFLFSLEKSKNMSLPVRILRYGKLGILRENSPLKSKRDLERFLMIMMVIIMLSVGTTIVMAMSERPINDRPTYDDAYTGPYKRMSPITTEDVFDRFAESSFVGNIYTNRDIVVDLDTGYKYLIKDYSNVDTWNRFSNNDYVIWTEGYRPTSEIHIHDITTRKTELIEMNDTCRIRNICGQWALINIYNDTSSRLTSLSLTTGELTDISVELQIGKTYSPLTDACFVYFRNDDESYHFYDIGENESRFLCSSKEEYRIEKIFISNRYLITIWNNDLFRFAADSSNEPVKNEILIEIYDRTKNYTLYDSIIEDDWWCLTSSRSGIVIADRYYPGFLYYNITSKEIEEWSVPFLRGNNNLFHQNQFLYFDNTYEMRGSIHTHNNRIIFFTDVVKKEALFYHFNSLSSVHILIFSVQNHVIWEFDPYADSDDDSILDIYDNDDDGDGVDDNKDFYLYDPLRSEVTYNGMEYYYIPPTGLIVIWILLIIIGIIVIWEFVISFRNPIKF